MLRVLLLWVRALSADADRTRSRLLRKVSSMSYDTAEPSRDWLASTSRSLLAWWIPQAAMLGGLFVSTPVRVIAWTLALVWMGTACILNSRRCGRTHCRYTGRYYLIMIVPVLVFGLASLGVYQWVGLGILIVAGSKLIWWASERAWGKFS